MNKKFLTAIILLIIAVLPLCSCAKQNLSTNGNENEISGINGDSADVQLGDAVSQGSDNNADKQSGSLDNSNADNAVDFSNGIESESNAASQQQSESEPSAPKTDKGSSASQTQTEETIESPVDEDGWINKWY